MTSTSNSDDQASKYEEDAPVRRKQDEMIEEDLQVTVEPFGHNPWGGADVPQPAAPTTGNGFGMQTGWVFNGTTWVMCFNPPPPGGTAW